MTAVYKSLPAREIIQRVATKYGLDRSVVCSRSRKPHISKARAECYVILRDEKDFSWQQIANLFSVKRESVRGTYIRHKRQPPVRIENSHEYLAALEAQMRRLCGVEIVHLIGDRLGIAPWCAIFLSVLIEAYPRYLTTEQMCELYDEAAHRLDHGNGEPVGPGMCRSFVSRIGREFEEMGLPHPIKRQKPHGIRLSDNIAPWMSGQFGRPVLYEATG